MKLLRKRTVEPVTADAPPPPRHIAVIMDGNGRWAKARHLPRSAGHKKGADALKRTLEGCLDLGVGYLTIYAFSSENWLRPAEEVGELMELLRLYLRREVQSLHQNGIRLRVIGDRARLAEDIRAQIDEAEGLTSANTRLHLTVALSYGGREEIVRAARAFAASGNAPESLTEEHFASYLDTADLPDPDLLIRTGGDHRISNFLLWQMAYTEFAFPSVLWPEFGPEHLREAIGEFQTRERRYGRVG